MITVIGPRQSGKSTLAKMAFPNKPYVTLEKLSLREFAITDPVGFLNTHARDGAILDEIQRAPGLLSEIQVRVDAKPELRGAYILTGSHQFILMESVTQSLAGRTAILKLLPFSLAERATFSEGDLPHQLFKGFYPRIIADNLDPVEALSFYVTTYVERDVREIMAIKDLSLFSRFLRLCAGRTGQILNASSLASDAGINHNTARSWLSLLEASFIITLLQPHHNNLNKRLIKAPKLYFWDVGLACHLLGIEKAEQVPSHPLVGALFETFVVTELMKQRLNQVRDPKLYFWRDNAGHEVDLLHETAAGITPIEVKSGATIQSDSWKGIDYYRRLNPQASPGIVVYGGEEDQERSNGLRILGFRHMDGLLG
ncbi:ATP-binding protein [Geobacter sp. OR-1]|uniref:ATP-binding protein n=1 Tax=Geobacter sp. OR-1 TaxID=1266765 RepID=UPI00192D14A5|nr:ATP-binding protein [Geobacter sp. OR-1]